MSQPLAGKTVTVSIDGDLNTDQLTQVIQRLFKVVGHPRCTSGVQLFFRQESELFTDPELKVRSTAT